MGLIRKWALLFSVPLGIGLAITIPLLLAIWTDDSSSNSRIAAVTALAVLMAAVASVVLLFLFLLVSVVIPKVLRRAMVWVTFKTVRGAISKQRTSVYPKGITTVNDDVGVVLPVGRNDRVQEGHRFVVENAADAQKWGTLEVAWVDEDTCTCSVSDRINEEFWGNLERRMRSEPSFPSGVTVRREIPEEYILDWLQTLLR